MSVESILAWEERCNAADEPRPCPVRLAFDGRLSRDEMVMLRESIIRDYGLQTGTAE